MCGRLNVTDDPAVQALCEQLQIQLWPEQGMHYSRFIRATDKVSVIHQKQGVRAIGNANWWLLLEPTETGFKPSKYTSFNTRYDKLNKPGSAGFKAYRQSRCVIPAKGFGETEFVNKKPLHYFDFTAVEGEALCLGGLCREWAHSGTGEVALSCSVITLPAHDKLRNIHSKASPLILPNDEQILNLWLDDSFHQVEAFDDLLQPHLPQDLIATQIDKPSHYQPIAEPFVIHKD